MKTPTPNEQWPAIFLDRDGTLMRDVEYCGKAEDVHVFAGVAEALARLKAAGYKIVVITNQSGLGRGYFTEVDYRAVEGELDRQVGEGLIDATYFCADLPGHASSRRKPEPGMVLAAARDLNLDLARSYFIGDKAIDAECGKRAGVRTILVQTGLESATDGAADRIARDLSEAAQMILAHGV